MSSKRPGPRRSNKRQTALYQNLPIRFLDRWAGGKREIEFCNLFYGLPTPGMRAWVDAGALIGARKRLIVATKFRRR